MPFSVLPNELWGLQWVNFLTKFSTKNLIKNPITVSLQYYSLKWFVFKLHLFFTIAYSCTTTNWTSTNQRRTAKCESIKFGHYKVKKVFYVDFEWIWIYWLGNMFCWRFRCYILYNIGAFFIVSFVVENIFFPSPGVSFIDDLIS